MCFVGFTTETTLHVETHLSVPTFRVIHSTNSVGTKRDEGKGLKGIVFRMGHGRQNDELKDWFGLVKKEVRQIQLPVMLGKSRLFFLCCFDFRRSNQRNNVLTLFGYFFSLRKW